MFKGDCNEGKNCKVKYTISIKNEDEDDSKGFVLLDVKRSDDDHDHVDKKTQIRGKKLFETCKTIINECLT